MFVHFGFRELLSLAWFVITTPPAARKRCKTCGGLGTVVR